MAKNVLPVDFQDDILAESMNGRRKYQMITNSDGTVSFVDVTEYTQVGSNFGQAQVNATNEAVNESADKNKIIDDKDDLVANSQAGMMAGALAVKAIREELTQNIKANIYAIVIDVIGSDTFSFKSRFDSIGSGRRQSVKIFGVANTIPVDGLLIISSSGICTWSGTGDVSAVMDYSGIVTVTLPGDAYDFFALMSPYVLSE